MDVDSSMVPEADHDSTGQNHAASLSEREQQAEAGESQASPSSSAGGSPKANQQQADSSQQSPVVGPRLAPTYSVVDTILEKKKDGPGLRCGHTLTAVAAVEEKGTPGYIGSQLILFGGAIALEGNSAASGAPSSAGNVGIL